MSDLIARFDAAIFDAWEPHPPPTPESLERIEKQFRCHFPRLLLEFARYSARYSNIFLSLGPDISNHSHIITKNQMVRSHPDWLADGRKAPEHLVLISDNFMEDFFWCLDISAPGTDYPVVLWVPEGRSGQPGSRHSNFEAFMIYQIEHYEGLRIEHGI